MNGLSLSEHLSRFVHGLAYEHLSADCVTKVKMYFLDWLGSAIAGGREPPVSMVLDVVRGLGGTPEATVIPNGYRTNGLLAALANGASSHIVEMDDLHRESILHPATVVMPAVLAAAEGVRASGRDMIAAIAAGYEVAVRIALAAGPAHYRHWHTTATCGTFGAAAAASKVLGLDVEGIVMAFGSAGTQAAGLWEFLVESAMSKQLHSGKAAMNGLLSSLLAKRGFTGARRILEGEKGFFRATSPDADPSQCLEGLGTEFRFERNSLKYHASCGHTHSAIDAVLQATGGKRLNPERITRAEVYVYREALDLLAKVQPATPYVAKFHFPFCVATAILYGRVGLSDFTEARLRDPRILRVMATVRLNEDPGLTRQYPARWPARVTLHTTDGGRLFGACDVPKGDPENPLTQPELTQKFEDLTRGLLSPADTTALCRKALDLERLNPVNLLFERPLHTGP